MSIPSRQIGWGTDSNLLWQIAKQLEKLIKVVANSPLEYLISLKLDKNFSTLPTASLPLSSSDTLVVNQSGVPKEVAVSEFGGGGTAKRTQTVEFAINQNIAGSTNWYTHLLFNANINTATLTATNASLTPINDFADMRIQTPCRQVNFDCKIKNARFRGGTNAFATDIRIVIIKSFGLSGINIANSDIIADKTFSTFDPNVNLCYQNFTGADLDDTVVIDGGSEIRFFLFNNNVASNLFSGILTVEFEEL